MIAELATDLLAKVRSVTALQDSTSLTLGGKKEDPALLKCPVPAAWAKFATDDDDEPPFGHGPASGFIDASQVMESGFLVTILVPYRTDDDLLTVQYPLLDAVVAAIHAQETPSGFRWRYAGQRIALVYTDRLAYEQRYKVDRSLSF